jgi:hypothetical protein
VQCECRRCLNKSVAFRRSRESSGKGHPASTLWFWESTFQVLRPSARPVQLRTKEHPQWEGPSSSPTRLARLTNTATTIQFNHKAVKTHTN